MQLAVYWAKPLRRHQCWKPKYSVNVKFPTHFLCFIKLFGCTYYISQENLSNPICQFKIQLSPCQDKVLWLVRHLWGTSKMLITTVGMHKYLTHHHTLTEHAHTQQWADYDKFQDIVARWRSVCMIIYLLQQNAWASLDERGHTHTHTFKQAHTQTHTNTHTHSLVTRTQLFGSTQKSFREQLFYEQY